MSLGVQAAHRPSADFTPSPTALPLVIHRNSPDKSSLHARVRVLAGRSRAQGLWNTVYHKSKPVKLSINTIA